MKAIATLTVNLWRAKTGSNPRLSSLLYIMITINIFGRGGVHRMMAYTGKALQPSVSHTHFNCPFIILISWFHFKIANVGYRVAGSESLRIDKLFSPLELVAKNTMLDVVLNELKSVLWNWNARQVNTGNRKQTRWKNLYTEWNKQ